MKKYLSFFTAFLIMFFLNTQGLLADTNPPAPATSVASAQTETMNKMNALGNSIKNEKSKVKAQIETLRLASRQSALDKLNEVVTKISALQNKVSVQIAKFDARGLDTTDAKNSIAAVDTKMSAVNANITQISAILSGSLATLSSTDKATLQALTNDTQTLLSDARQALTDAVKSLQNTINN